VQQISNDLSSEIVSRSLPTRAARASTVSNPIFGMCGRRPLARLALAFGFAQEGPATSAYSSLWGFL